VPTQLPERKKGTYTWNSYKSHVGWGQEPYDAEYVEIARSLRVAAFGMVTIFTDAKAAIWGRQKYADPPRQGTKR